MPTDQADQLTALASDLHAPCESLQLYLDSRTASMLLRCMRASIREKSSEPSLAAALPYTVALLIEFCQKSQEKAKGTQADTAQSLAALLAIFHAVVSAQSAEVTAFLTENAVTTREILHALTTTPFTVYAKMEKAFAKSSPDARPQPRHSFAYAVLETCCAVCAALVPAYAAADWWPTFILELFPSLYSSGTQAFTQRIFPAYAAVLTATIASQLTQNTVCGLPCRALIAPLFESVTPVAADGTAQLFTDSALYARGHTMCTIFSSLYAPFVLQVFAAQPSSQNQDQSPLAADIARMADRVRASSEALAQALSSQPTSDDGRVTATILAAIRLAAAFLEMCSAWKYTTGALPEFLRSQIVKIAAASASTATMAALDNEAVAKAVDGASRALKVAAVKCLPAADVLSVFPLCSGDANTQLCAENYDVLDIFDAYLTNDDPQVFTEKLVPIARWCYAMHEKEQAAADGLRIAAIDMRAVFYKIWALAGAFARGSQFHERHSPAADDFFREISQKALLRSPAMCSAVCDAVAQCIARCTLSSDHPMQNSVRSLARNVIPRLCNAFSALFLLKEDTDEARGALETKILTRMHVAKRRFLAQPNFEKKALRTLESGVLDSLRASTGKSDTGKSLRGLQREGNFSKKLNQVVLLYTIQAYAKIAPVEDISPVAAQMCGSLLKTIEFIFGADFQANAAQIAGSMAGLTHLCVTLINFIAKEKAVAIVDALMQKVSPLMLALQSAAGPAVEVITFFCTVLALSLIAHFGLEGLESVQRVRFVRACGDFVCRSYLKHSAESSSFVAADTLDVSLESANFPKNSLFANKSVLHLLLRELMRFEKELVALVRETAALAGLQPLIAGLSREMSEKFSETSEAFPIIGSHSFAFDAGATYWRVYPPSLAAGTAKFAALRLASFTVPRASIAAEVRHIFNGNSEESAKPASVAATRPAPRDAKRGKRDARAMEDDEADAHDDLGERTARKRSRGAAQRDAAAGQAGAKGTSSGQVTSVFRQLYSAHKQRQTAMKRSAKKTAFPQFAKAKNAYSSKRAKGDMRKPNMPAPYAYFPLGG